MNPSKLSVSPDGPQQPEPSSINDILRKNSRDRLFVRPMRWMSQHLRLLGCQFLLEEGGLKSQATNTGGNKRPMNLVSDLFPDHDIRSRGSKLSFRFHQKVIKTLQGMNVRLLCSCLPNSPGPFFASLDMHYLRSQAEMSVVVSTPERANPPVDRLRLKRQRRCRPANEIEDPYIVVVLIALAQAQRRSCKTAAYFKTHVLNFSLDGYVFYTARFPAAFLDRFDHPSQYFPSDPVIISYYSIPIAPTEDMLREIREAMFGVGNNGQREEMERPSKDKPEEP